jgi:RimJ/RimL family protein N-acetyltransferase
MHLLVTARLHLAPLAPSDTDALHALWTTAGVRRYLWDDEWFRSAEPEL